jgi:hypothetical protein
MPDVSVVTAAPSIKYFVLPNDVSGATGAVIVELVLSYTAVPTVILKFVIEPGKYPP